MEKNVDLKKVSLELDKEISKLNKSLSKLETDIGLLQFGNNKMPYWNGANAYDVVVSSTGHFYHDKKLLVNIEKCTDYISKLN